MKLSNMNDEQILEFISTNLEKKRLAKPITSESLADKGGHVAQTYSNFVNKNTNIRVSTLIQILRGLGELDRFQACIEYKEPYVPSKNNTSLPQRIRKKVDRKVAKRPLWGDEK